jgi:hypothetical protein
MDSDEMERNGIDIGEKGRLKMMFKIEEGNGMKINKEEENELNINKEGNLKIKKKKNKTDKKCLTIENMFENEKEKKKKWDVEISDDVIEE